MGAGAELLGEGESDTAGYTVSTASDQNGDGLADLLIGSPKHDATGAVYLIYGIGQ